MKNISLRGKLYSAFGIIGVFIVFLAVMATFFITSMGDITKELADHPYTVTNAIKDLKIAGFEQIVILDHAIEDNEVLASHVTEINVVHNEALDDINIIYDRYLGNMDDVTNLEEDYLKINSEVIRALDAIENNELVLAKSIQSDLHSLYVPNFAESNDTIKTFAENKAIEYQNQSDEIRSSYAYFVGIVSVSVLAIEVLVSVLIIKDISPSMRDIVKAISRTKKGFEYKAINSDRKDELGLISNNLDDMFIYLKTQKEIEELNYKLRNLQDRENLRITLMSIGDGVITTDTLGKITNINPIAIELTGYKPAEALGKNVNDIFMIIDKITRKEVVNPINKALKNKKTYSLDKNTVLVSKSGKEYDVSDSASPIIGEDGDLHGAVLVFRDITDEYRQKQEIEYLSYHDSLTGLYNRNHLEIRFGELSKKRKGKVAVLMGDVNGLKITNDAFGHDFGDKLLKIIANILQDALMDYNADIVRWGGDEFVIIVEDSSQDDINEILFKIEQLSTQSKEDTPVKPNISFGYAIWSKNRGNIYRSLINAEDMMYENKLLQKDSLRSAIVSSLESSLFEKSYETEEHANRVADYAKIICDELKLSETETNGVILLSKLHDIGKISIDDGILLKTGKLNEDEWKTIKKHPETGFRIATGLHELAHIAEGILSHHEHYDGNGYPRGLKGENIPLEARIVAIADAYDVMTSNRAYKKAVSKEKAIQELISCSSTQFDPELVQIFIKNI